MVVKVGVGLLGLGIVGGGVVLIFQNFSECYLLVGELELICVVVCDLNCFWFVVLDESLLIIDLLVVIQDLVVDVVVEVIGGLELVCSLIFQVIVVGKFVVIVNKVVIVCYGQEIVEVVVVVGVYVLIEVVVGGGIFIIELLKQFLGGNCINCVSGIINGIINYIFICMVEEGVVYDVVFKDVQELGYVEVDLVVDVDGFDVVDKIVILVILVFGGSVDCVVVFIDGISGLQGVDVDYVN